MKKFMLKLILFFSLMSGILILMLCFGVFIVGNQFSGSYQASAIDKINRLENLESPKIILVGNSNLAFGIDSELIEKELGMPVVNLGLHGGLSNSFHERMANYNINKGDIVVICHTSYADNCKIGDVNLAWATIEYNKDLYSLIGESDIYDMIKAYPNYFCKTVFRWITNYSEEQRDTCYKRSAFNKYGDIVYRPSASPMVFNEGSIHVPRINDMCVSRLNEMNESINEHGARLVVAGYPIAYGKYTPPKEDYIEFQKELDEKLNCEIISDFTEYFIPYECFYNTVNHLTDDGVEIRTKQLISDIKNWKENNS